MALPYVIWAGHLHVLDHGIILYSAIPQGGNRLSSWVTVLPTALLLAAIGPKVIGTHPGSQVAKKACDLCDSPCGMGLKSFFIIVLLTTSYQ